MAVVPLYGDVVPATKEPRVGVIEELERALEAARSGDVQGIALAMFHHDSTASWAIQGVANTLQLAGAIAVMASEQIDEIKEDQR